MRCASARYLFLCSGGVDLLPHRDSVVRRACPMLKMMRRPLRHSKAMRHKNRNADQVFCHLMKKRLSARQDLLSEKLVRAVLGKYFTLESFCVDRVRDSACCRGRMEVTPAVGSNVQRHQVRALCWLVGVPFVGTPTVAGVASHPFLLLHARAHTWQRDCIEHLRHCCLLVDLACAGTGRSRANCCSPFPRRWNARHEARPVPVVLERTQRRWTNTAQGTRDQNDEEHAGRVALGVGSLGEDLAGGIVPRFEWNGRAVTEEGTQVHGWLAALTNVRGHWVLFVQGFHVPRRACVGFVVLRPNASRSLEKKETKRQTANHQIMKEKPGNTLKRRALHIGMFDGTTRQQGG